MSQDTESKTESFRNELKKLSPEDRIRLLQDIAIEEVKAEEEKIKADPMFPLKSAIVNMSNEVESLKKQIENLKYEISYRNKSQNSFIISNNEMNDDEDYNEEYCNSFSWWPIIIFFLFIIITSSIGGGSVSRCPMMPKMRID
jgi:hypothetical protein